MNPDPEAQWGDLIDIDTSKIHDYVWTEEEDVD